MMQNITLQNTQQIASQSDTNVKTFRTMTIKLMSPLFATAALMMLAACTTPSTLMPATEARIDAAAAPKMASEQLLHYLLTVRAMTPTDFVAEKERVRADFLHHKTEFNRIKLALLMALSPSMGSNVTATSLAAANSADDAELTTLLEPLTASSASSSISTPRDLQALAMLIQGWTQDRKKLREQLRDSLNRTQMTRRDELSSQSEARILRAKVEDLEKKLDALKSIERSVSVKSDARNNPAPSTRTDGNPK